MKKENRETTGPVEATNAAAGNRADLPGDAASEPGPPEGSGTPGEGSALREGEAASPWAREKEELICLVQRKQADFDNFRRISRMKEEEIRTYGLSRFLERLLPVLDNMERALETAREDDSVPESYLQGLLMIRKQLQQLLDQEGVSEIDSIGKEFDPRYHDAVAQTAAGEGEPGSVVEEFEKGYLYKDRVLRHAKVKVMQS